MPKSKEPTINPRLACSCARRITGSSLNTPCGVSPSRWASQSISCYAKCRHRLCPTFHLSNRSKPSFAQTNRGGGLDSQIPEASAIRIDSNNVSTSFSSARPATEVVRPPEGLVPPSGPHGLTHSLIDLSCCLSLDPSAGREQRTARFHLAPACHPRRP